MGLSQTAASGGFGGFKGAETEKEDSWKLCLDKADVMRLPVINKKAYMASNCIPIYNRHSHSKRVALERKFYQRRDDIYDTVITALKLRDNQSLAAVSNNTKLQ